MDKLIYGTVSYGTLRTEDLLRAFSKTLRAITDHPGSLTMAAEAETAIENGNADSPEAAELVGDLFDLLNEYAPAGYYFGAHAGDGADFGFWMTDPHSPDDSDQ